MEDRLDNVFVGWGSLCDLRERKGLYWNQENGAIESLRHAEETMKVEKSLLEREVGKI